MRSWIGATWSLASVVTTAHEETHAPVAGSFQSDHRPAIASKPDASRGPSAAGWRKNGWRPVPWRSHS